MSIVYRNHLLKSAAARATLCALLFVFAQGRAGAQADAGPMRPPAGSAEPGEESGRSQPQQRMRTVGSGAAQPKAVELAAGMEDVSGRISAALEGWQDASGQPRRPKVVVLDFRTWDKRWMSFGSWLADKFSSALASQAGSFEVISREKLGASLEAKHLASSDEFDSKRAVELAQSVGADIIVDGIYSAQEKDLGLTVYARRALAEERRRPVYFGKFRILMSNEIAPQLGMLLNWLGPQRDVYAPGRDGVSYPTCIYCPGPKYPHDTLTKKVAGVVALWVWINVDGRASDIYIYRPLEPLLDQLAIDAVKNWKFRPATDSSGVPVEVHQLVEVAFRP